MFHSRTADSPIVLVGMPRSLLVESRRDTEIDLVAGQLAESARRRVVEKKKKTARKRLLQLLFLLSTFSLSFFLRLFPWLFFLLLVRSCPFVEARSNDKADLLPALGKMMHAASGDE